MAERRYALIGHSHGSSSITYAETAAETAAGITPTDTQYPEGNVLRYGADPTGVSDSSSAFGDVMTAGGFSIYIPSGTYLVSPQSVDATNHILIGSNTTIYCEPGVTVEIPLAAGSVGSPPQANRGAFRFRDVSNCVVYGNNSD